MPLVIPDDALREAGLSEKEPSSSSPAISSRRESFISGAQQGWPAGAVLLSKTSSLRDESPGSRPDESDLTDDLAALDRLGI